MTKIIQENNFLTKQECNFLIKFHNDNYSVLGNPHYETQVLNLTNHIINYDFIKYFYAKIAYHIQNVNKNLFINYFEIVKWFENDFMDKHYDFDYHTYTSVIYLNDDFKGGETFVNDLKIIPEIGKIVTFQGSLNIHGVLKITKGNRYTLPIWYKSI